MDAQVYQVASVEEVDISGLLQEETHEMDIDSKIKSEQTRDPDFLKLCLIWRVVSYPLSQKKHRKFWRRLCILRRQMVSITSLIKKHEAVRELLFQNTYGKRFWLRVMEESMQDTSLEENCIEQSVEVGVGLHFTRMSLNTAETALVVQ